MASYALSTNLYTFAQLQDQPSFLGWPAGSGEAEVIKKLSPADVIIPKFSQSPSFGGRDAEADLQKKYCEAIAVSYEDVLKAYEGTVKAGANALPFLMKVVGPLEDDSRYPGVPWVRVEIEIASLELPLSAQEFLLLRELSTSVAAQFKGAVATGRHLQEIPDAVVEAVESAGKLEDKSDYLRRYSVVDATTAEAAEEILSAASREPREGDRVFIASPGILLGIHDATVGGHLQPVGQPIPKSPDELIELFDAARVRARKEDYFNPQRAILAANELKDLLEGPQNLLVVDDLGRFHDRYNLLGRKITQALSISQRPAPLAPSTQAGEPEEEEEELDEVANLQGLTIDVVRNELPPGMVMPDSVLAEVVTALRAGKHLLLGGPPGTGKTTLAEAVCRAVLGNNYDVVTGTADWTTFDTIGGYMPSPDGLMFEPGIVLRSLQRGAWLVIDELNRADIDKAFGPLFTLLAGAGADQPSRRVVLPYQQDGHNIEIRWSDKRSTAPGQFTLNPEWRLVGTLNLSDKATLFQLSFAFLRRFAVIDVPLPPRAGYESFMSDLCSEVDATERDDIVSASMELAFGPRLLGPAILRDVAMFLAQGLADTATGQPTYSDPVTAFVTAIRLYAVPQYEGATAADVAKVISVFRSFWPDRPDHDWQPLSEALNAVALA